MKLSKRAISAHPWWVHVPQGQRRTMLGEVRKLRLQALLGRKDVRILLLLVVYLLFCLIPVLLGLPVLGVIAALQLLLVPPVGYLAYGLVWREFHR